MGPAKTASVNSEFQLFHQSYKQGDHPNVYPLHSEPASASTIKYSWGSSSEEEDEERRVSSSDDGQEQNHGRGDRNHLPNRLSKMVLEIYEKFPESMRNQLNLEELFTLLRERKARRHSKQKVKITTTSRGGHGAMEELSKKLERFKIRTVVVEDIDKKEEAVKI